MNHKVLVRDDAGRTLIDEADAVRVVVEELALLRRRAAVEWQLLRLSS